MRLWHITDVVKLSDTPRVGIGGENGLDERIMNVFPIYDGQGRTSSYVYHLPTKTTQILVVFLFPSS